MKKLVGAIITISIIVSLVGICLIFGVVMYHILPKKDNSNIIDRTCEIECFTLYKHNNYCYGLRLKDDDDVCIHAYPIDRTRLIVDNTIKHSRIHFINSSYAIDYDYVIYLSTDDLKNNQELFETGIDRFRFR
jgi:hypothetical protein